MGITHAVAARADCTRARVGAVIVASDRRIVATGYNGGPSGGPSCLAGDCPRGRLSLTEAPPGGSYGNCISLHAEQNAIAYADHRDTDGGTIYITRPPCDMCAKLIQAAGIVRVVFPEGTV